MLRADWHKRNISPMTEPIWDTPVNPVSWVILQASFQQPRLLGCRDILHRKCSNGCLVYHHQISAQLKLYRVLSPSNTEPCSEVWAAASCRAMLLAATWETSQHVNSEVWAPAIPRALCYIEKQPHMIDKAAWESYGQFRPLGAARNGCAASAKGEHEFHSINRELHIHS
ncbi:unnamed protein product [Prunus brigantina]